MENQWEKGGQRYEQIVHKRGNETSITFMKTENENADSMLQTVRLKVNTGVKCVW